MGTAILGILLTFALGLPLVVVLHEAGHALTALAVGFRVCRVELGSSRVWWRGSLGGTELLLGTPALRGRVWAVPRGLSGFRWRKAAISLGGPLMSGWVALVFVVVGLQLPLGVSSVLCWLFASLNAAELTNLVPSRHRITDGGNVLRVLTASEVDLHRMAEAAMAHELE